MWHGELVNIASVTKKHETIDWTMDDRLEGKIPDVGVHTFAKVVYENMTIDAET